MKRYVIPRRQSYRHYQRSANCLILFMTSGAHNITVSYHQHDAVATASIDSTKIFVVFAVALTLSAKSDIAIQHDGFGRLSSFCFERNFSYDTDRTFFCPYYSIPKTSHSITVWGLRKEITEDLSIIILVNLHANHKLSNEK